MKFKKSLKTILIVLVALNVLVFVTGNTHLYKGIANTYLKGRSGPDIDELDIFPSREFEARNPIPWKQSNNTQELSEDFEKYLDSLETVGFLVIKNDSILHESYWEGWNEDKVSNSFSMGKTFMSVLIGIAIHEGLIESEDDPVYKYLPQYEEGKNKELTIKHLLTMSSGMDFDESYGNPFGFNAKAFYGDDLPSLVEGYSVIEDPGKEFKYLSGNTQILVFLLEKVTQKSVGQYAQEKLWSKIGAEKSAYWILDKEGGHEKGFTGVYATARDYAKMGRLYMNGGSVYGNKLLNPKYVFNSITPAKLIGEDGKPLTEYGYSWWLLEYKKQKVFYMRGILGQYVICLPQKNTIIVRLGRKRAEKSDGKHPDDVYFYIDEALKMVNQKK